MSVVVKSSDEIERMRIAGRLASEVLAFITPHVRPGVTTGQLNDLCDDYMVTVIKDGFHGDCSRMFYVGEPNIQARRLVEVTHEYMWLGIQQVRPGARLG